MFETSPASAAKKTTQLEAGQQVEGTILAVSGGLVILDIGVSADASLDLIELTDRGLATDGAVNADGVAYRQGLEDRLDHLASEPWRLLGADLSRQLVDLLEPVTDALMARIDATAGPNWMPAGRPKKDPSR